MSLEKFRVNTVPSLTWNWMKMNGDSVEIATDFTCAEASFEKLPEGVEKVAAAPETELKSDGSAVLCVPAISYGDKIKKPQNTRLADEAEASRKKLTQLVDSVVKAPQTFVVRGNVTDPLVLNLNASGTSASVQSVYVTKESECTIVLLFSSSDKNDSENDSVTQFVQTRIFAEKDSKVHVVKVQMLDADAFQLDDTDIVAGENASVKFTQIQAGGKHVDSGFAVKLQGDKASFVSNVAYICQNNQYLDLNHIVRQYGKKTMCNMHVDGTLKDESVKIYKGVIDLKKNCSGSTANEMENVMVLSSKVVNKSMPVILCSEDNVAAEHGATIGRIAKDVLFYMQSRGIDEKQAERILARAKIQAVIDMIPSEQIQKSVAEWLDRSIIYE